MEDPVPLNPYQRNHLLASLQQIDKLLVDIEMILGVEPEPLFQRHVHDLSREEPALIQSFLRELRQKMAGVLERCSVPHPQPFISAVHAIKTDLEYADIAAEELRPQFMKAYGRVAEAAAPQLETLAEQLQAALRTLNGSLPERKRA